MDFKIYLCKILFLFHQNLFTIIVITNQSKIKEIARKITQTNGQLNEYTIFNNDLMEIWLKKTEAITLLLSLVK